MSRLSIPLYQVDAFSDRLFAGNPAAVCPLEAWLEEATLQAIAAENNLSETAFFVPRGSGTDGEYDLRWFTPRIEVDLCGHATLASGHVVLAHLAPKRDAVGFHTRSGRLEVARDGERLAMNLPAQKPPRSSDGRLMTAVAEALGHRPSELFASHTVMAVFDDAAAVAGLEPDFAAVARLAIPYVIATAPGDDVDFVSRFFAPGAGIDEDPVTGSAHTLMTPYWAERLGRTELTARQLSERGGSLWCRLAGERVVLSGHAVDYLHGTITVDVES